jgi:hypothetical protein
MGKVSPPETSDRVTRYDSSRPVHFWRRLIKALMRRRCYALLVAVLSIGLIAAVGPSPGGVC